MIPGSSGVWAADRDAWIFTKGQQSVRIFRTIATDGLMRLLVHGPDADEATYDVCDVVQCVSTQADIERKLTSQGFYLERFTPARRDGPLA